MKFKKIIAVLSAGIILSAGLAACGGNSNSKTDEAATNTTTSKEINNNDQALELSKVNIFGIDISVPNGWERVEIDKNVIDYIDKSESLLGGLRIIKLEDPDYETTTKEEEEEALSLLAENKEESDNVVFNELLGSKIVDGTTGFLYSGTYKDANFESEVGTVIFPMKGGAFSVSYYPLSGSYKDNNIFEDILKTISIPESAQYEDTESNIKGISDGTVDVFVNLPLNWETQEEGNYISYSGSNNEICNITTDKSLAGYSSEMIMNEMESEIVNDYDVIIEKDTYTANGNDYLYYVFKNNGEKYYVMGYIVTRNDSVIMTGSFPVDEEVNLEIYKEIFNSIVIL